MASGAALAAASRTAGTPSSKAARKAPVVICEIGAASGPFTQLGLNDEAGAAGWATYVNAHGGLLGHPVELVKENDGSNPTQAATLVRKCVTQVHASFIFGPEESSTDTAAVPIANSLRTVEITWGSGWRGQGLSGSELTGYAFPGIANLFHADDAAFVQKVIAPRHYRRVAVIEDDAPGGLGNASYTASLGKRYGFTVVARQRTTPGATDDTPQVLKLLAAKPQAIVLGTIPGPDTITAITAIRAQDPTIPIGECSSCTMPSFISAAGGYTNLKNVFMVGTPQELVATAPRTPANLPGIESTARYIHAMVAAGMRSANLIDHGSNAWAAGEELVAAVNAAKSLNEPAVREALSHQNIFVGGYFAMHFARTPSDYSRVVAELSATAVLQPDGHLVVYK